MFQVSEYPGKKPGTKLFFFTHHLLTDTPPHQCLSRATCPNGNDAWRLVPPKQIFRSLKFFLSYVSHSLKLSLEAFIKRLCLAEIGSAQVCITQVCFRQVCVAEVCLRQISPA